MFNIGDKVRAVYAMEFDEGESIKKGTVAEIVEEDCKFPVIRLANGDEFCVDADEIEKVN